jgi:Flp pilus assembly protein TadB
VSPAVRGWRVSGCEVSGNGLTYGVSGIGVLAHTKEGIMECPYCSEEIKESAKKCKHCGEWLEQTDEWSGSSNARAVNKGLKDKEFDDFAFTFVMLLTILFSIVVGYYTHLLVGIAVFIVLGMVVSVRYYNE